MSRGSSLGRSSPAADNALARLYTAYRQVQPRNDIQTKSLDTSLGNLDSIRLARTERILQARIDVGPPWSLWVVILLTSGLVLGCAIIYGVEKPTMHYVMVASLGVLVAAALFMVLEFSHPYIGELATSPEPLHEVIQVLSKAPA